MVRPTYSSFATLWEVPSINLSNFNDNYWECQESNSGLLGEKCECNLCAIPLLKGVPCIVTRYFCQEKNWLFQILGYSCYLNRRNLSCDHQQNIYVNWSPLESLIKSIGKFPTEFNATKQFGTMTKPGILFVKRMEGINILLGYLNCLKRASFVMLPSYSDSNLKLTTIGSWLKSKCKK